MEDNKKQEKIEFKYQSVKFKVKEVEYIEEYCKKYGIAKNTLLRKAVMEYIERPFI